jgi:hypothetical protein
VSTSKLQLTIDAATVRIIEDMIRVGIHGTTKAEVASWIIRNWIWSNQEQLRQNGISLAQPEPNKQ